MRQLASDHTFRRQDNGPFGDAPAVEREGISGTAFTIIDRLRPRLGYKIRKALSASIGTGDIDRENVARR